MTEQEFDKKLQKSLKVQEQIKKLQEDNLNLDMEIYNFLIEKFETKEQFEEWSENNKIPGFIHLLMLNHFKGKTKIISK